ncbi:MAG: hypothetical protein AcusKO_04390 [Acuticoccus sp.]
MRGIDGGRIGRHQRQEPAEPPQREPHRDLPLPRGKRIEGGPEARLAGAIGQPEGRAHGGMEPVAGRRRGLCGGGRRGRPRVAGKGRPAEPDLGGLGQRIAAPRCEIDCVAHGSRGAFLDRSERTPPHTASRRAGATKAPAAAGRLSAR